MSSRKRVVADREEAVLESGASNVASSSQNADVSRKRMGVAHVTSSAGVWKLVDSPCAGNKDFWVRGLKALQPINLPLKSHRQPPASTR